MPNLSALLPSALMIHFSLEAKLEKLLNMFLERILNKVLNDRNNKYFKMVQMLWLSDRIPSNLFSRSRSCGSRQLWYNRLETMNARQMSKFSSPSSKDVILVINCSPSSMVNGDKARADEIMETGLDAGRDDGRDPDRDRDIVGKQFWLFCQMKSCKLNSLTELILALYIWRFLAFWFFRKAQLFKRIKCVYV